MAAVVSLVAEAEMAEVCTPLQPSVQLPGSPEGVL